MSQPKVGEKIYVAHRAYGVKNKQQGLHLFIAQAEVIGGGPCQTSISYGPEAGDVFDHKVRLRADDPRLASHTPMAALVAFRARIERTLASHIIGVNDSTALLEEINTEINNLEGHA